ncbi:MAG: hypothetical protein ABI639_01910 [Thermoanaerobaculia bacterium]
MRCSAVSLLTMVFLAFTAVAAVAQAPTAGSQEAAMGIPYVEGSTYGGNDKIVLGAGGQVLSVQAGTGKMADYGEGKLFVVVVTVAGAATNWSFAFGTESSGFSLDVDGKRYAAIDAQFAATVVSTTAPGEKPERSRSIRAGVTSVRDTTEHPLAVLFRLPAKALAAQPKTLFVREMNVAGKSYSFALRFDG